MIFFKIIKKHIVPLILVIFLTVFAYSSLPNTFFQQDEWQFFAGNIYYESKGIAGIIESFFPTAPTSHFNPLGMTYTWLTYFLFGTNFTPYAWLSIFLHTLNALLLYYFVFSWLKSRKIALISGLFFGVNSIPYQAVTWVQAIYSYEIPVALILLSLIFFQRFITYKKHWRINILLSLTMFFVSLLFHEIGIFLFLSYTIIFFLDVDLWRKKMLRFFLSALAIFALAFFLIRVPFFFGFITSLPELTDISRPPISVYPYRIVSIGMKSLAGALIPEKTLITISEGLTRLAYPQFITPDSLPNPFISQSIVFDLTSYVLTVAIVGIVLLFVRFIPEKNIKRALVWTLLFTFMSFIPYGFVLGKAGYASILEPKFFYVGSIGLSILIAIIVYSLLYRFSKQKILKVIIYLLLSSYLGYHLHAVKTYLNNLAEISTQRKSFLATIKSAYEKLPKNVIFFTQSDIAYYGMPDNEKILPVQIGFGKMLMIWYQKDEQFPGCLYEGQFLLKILEQRYKECNGRGFGYFRDYVKLKDAIKTYKIPFENIIAFSWDGDKESFTDITKSTREKLSADAR